jgi:hypothetical protein
VMAVPGLRPTSPVMVVDPVLVMVAAAMTEKAPALPMATGPGAAEATPGQDEQTRTSATPIDPTRGQTFRIPIPADALAMALIQRPEQECQ